MSKRKLLLADDSVTIQKVVNLTFADEGIEVITTGDGNSAMEKVREIKPDLVMADVNMPGINGYQICEQIKHDEATKQTPVILLVGSFEPFDEEKAQAVGADDYLTKPFQSIRQLVSKVNDLLTANAPKDSSTVSFEDTLEIKEQTETPQNKFDDQMDDEMIETSRMENHPSSDLSSSDAQPKFEAAKSSSAPAESFSEIGYEEQSADVAPVEKREETEHQTSDKIKEFYAEGFQIRAEVKEIPSAVAENVSNADYISPDVSPQTVEEPPNYQQERELETENRQEEYDDETADSIPQPVSASVLNFDEFDLLELPPVDTRNKEESPEKQVDAKAETQPETQPEGEPQNKPETFQADEKSKVKNEVARQVSSLDFPPEVIEAIAEKVVEKLSERLKE